ncbi:TEL2-interacting protein 1 [Sphaceloma murrayae]|uniref:TEL2-interacting protein 1 n=1 Tax=Sphaceloma murrayae TaxID=2082308 RepID=A0A2K1QQU1_9PEZI|nr:TEL2-interacting protein 1 [Sphaceloma murrayae]
MESRNVIFQQLKPPCVALNQAILRLQGHNAGQVEALTRLESLQRTLQQIPEGRLDPKLAEYVFIPISQVLKASQKLPIRASEIAFQCIGTLLRDGWRESIAGPLAPQLLILLAITADRSGKRGVHVAPSDDLLEAVFACMKHLFDSLRATQEGRRELVRSTAAPHLGHTVTVVLDGLAAEHPRAVQTAAIEALASLITSISDWQVLASFLPGIVSALTKVLTPSTQARRPWKVLVLCIQALKSLLLRTVSDNATKDITKHDDKILSATTETTQRSLDSSWLHATAGQLKLAMANINRLHAHDRVEVRQSLLELNVSLLESCSKSLPNCQQMSLEILTVLLDDEAMASSRSRLLELVKNHQDLATILRDTLQHWSMSLPRILEGSDEDKKAKRLRQTFMAYNMLLEAESDFSTVQSLMIDTMPPMLSSIIGATAQSRVQAQPEAPAVRLDDLPSALQIRGSTVFPDALSTSQHQMILLGIVQQQMQDAADLDRLGSLAEHAAWLVRESTGASQISAFYLALAALRTRSESDALFDLGPAPWREDVLQDLYGFSLDVLLSQDSSPHQLVLLSLETLALQAMHLRQDFRPELLDALYPVLSLLASPSPRIRNHAITALNILAESCEYVSVKELVVENADYLVNAVALKLNAYEVDPEAPQVLAMSVKLAGSDIVPYLGDTVDAIFGILEDYHGYERLVELLFGALKAITEAGSKEPRLAIEGNKPSDYRYEDPAWTPTTISTLTGLLRDRKARQSHLEEPSTRDRAPQEPWTSPTNVLDPPEPAAPPPEPSDPLPAPQTYPLLLRISSLTAHFLPFPSPTLRASLLHLLTDAVPGLASHENSFLPLINTLWPEIVNRLGDEEEYVVIAALGTVETLCRFAKGFMRSRVADLSGEIRRVYRRVESEVDRTAGTVRKDGAVGGRTVRRIEGPKEVGRVVVETEKGLGQRMELRYVDPGLRALWDGLRTLLITVVRDVGVAEDLFDDVLGMLRPVGKLSREQRGVLESVNVGAVWLAMYKEDNAVLDVPQRIASTRERWNWAGIAA